MFETAKRLWDEYVPAASFFRKGMMDKPGTAWDESYIAAKHRPQIEAAIKNMIDSGGEVVDYHHWDGTGSPYKKILGKFTPEPVLLEDGTTGVRIRDEFDTNATNKHLSKEISSNLIKNPARSGWKIAEAFLKARTDLVHGQDKKMPGFDATLPISPDVYAGLTKRSVSTPSVNVLNDTLARNSQSDSYVVAPGDNLTSIAQRNGMTLDELLAMNKQIKNPNLVGVGQSLKLLNRSL